MGLYSTSFYWKQISSLDRDKQENRFTVFLSEDRYTKTDDGKVTNLYSSSSQKVPVSVVLSCLCLTAVMRSLCMLNLCSYTVAVMLDSQASSS